MYFECLLCMGYCCNAMNGLQGDGTGNFHFKRKKVTFGFPKDSMQGEKGWGAERGPEEKGGTIHTPPRLLVRKCVGMGIRRTISIKDEEIAAQVVKLTRGLSEWWSRMQRWPLWFPDPALHCLPHRRAELDGVELNQLNDLEQATELL